MKELINELGGLTSRLVGLALDASQLRQQVIATNIANANIAGYVPLRVNFQQQLDLARQDFLDRSQDANSISELKNLKPTIERTDEGVGQVAPKVQIDQEVARMTENVVHYEALLTGLSSRTAILKLAIKDGGP